MDALRAVSPQVVVVDVAGEGRPGARRLLADVAAHAPDAHLLVLTETDDAATLTEAFAAGADGYLTSSASIEELERAVRMLAGGWPVVTPAQLLRVLRGDVQAAPRPRKPTAATLTGREREVLRRLVHGASTVQMSVELGITVPTVRSHVQSVLSKLGVHSKLEAAARASTLQLV
jgi:DNA-binding NarL/FixJ family response regulator